MSHLDDVRCCELHHCILYDKNILYSTATFITAADDFTSQTLATPVIMTCTYLQCHWLHLFHGRTHTAYLSLSLCLEWYDGSITPRLHSGMTKPAQC